jgi:uridine kinase
MRSDHVPQLSAVIRERARELARPCVVAVDGRSGSGKSTLAAQLTVALDAALLDGDDFFAGGVEVRGDTPEDRASACIDWSRQRPVLEALRAARPASYLAFDWAAFDGRLRAAPTSVESRAIVIFAGVYSARPELCDLVDLRVLLCVTEEVRSARVQAREGSINAWERQWHEAEDWYFAHRAPPPHFDVILQG